ncbi:MAG: leucyl aminopeptidase family protein [Rhizobiales bacterium]|nr:leucyl aminopeptidase family protein [Hyphomicrobiales bacterium]
MQRAWIQNTGFAAGEGEMLLVPDTKGKVARVMFGLGKGPAERQVFGKLPISLPDGEYELTGQIDEPELAALSWQLGSYSFDKYKKNAAHNARLVMPRVTDAKKISQIAEGVFLTRNLINTPANDMGPGELEKAVRDLAKRFRATVKVTSGDKLLKDNFPLIHAVGRASIDAPRLVDMKWGKANAPKITLVGKGVCFDTGGLDLKPPAGMITMKKDMGGAANVLGLAAMIMAAKLPIRLRVLIPAVENSVSGNAFRPSDVIKSRKGMSVEIGNTDAEGRLVLADALTLADDEKPDLLVDMATLTGAARVALGPDLPPFFTSDDGFAKNLESHADAVDDPLWRMPLWSRYDSLLHSGIADVNNISPGSHAGAITAALFLARFVEKTKSYVHLDTFAWNPKARPGRPEGGEAQGIRALFSLLSEKYGG